MESVSPVVNVDHAEELKPVKVFYILIAPEAENKFNLPINCKVSFIGVSRDSGWVQEGRS